MARSVNDILDKMIATKEGTPELAELNSTSKVAVWRLIFHVCAVAIFSLESVFDFFRNETEDRIKRKRTHGLFWYAKKAKEFRDGIELNWVDEVEAFAYPAPVTNEDITEQLVVTHAAVHEAPRKLRIKIASKGADGLLQPVTNQQASRVEFYMNQIKDAGNDIEIVNLPPDDLKITGVVIIDPLLLQANGERINGGGNPLEEAARYFVNTQADLNFDGEFVVTEFIDALQKADGVINPAIINVQSRYGSQPFTNVEISRMPNAGYFNITELEIEYRAATNL